MSDDITVLTWGVFDLLHPGHMRLLRKASQLGTRLIVGINSDMSVRCVRRSDHRPILSELERQYMLKHVLGVDDVEIFNEMDASELIYRIRPRFAVKASSIPSGEAAAIHDVGAKFVRLLPLKSHPHTSEMIAQAHTIYEDEVLSWRW